MRLLVICGDVPLPANSGGRVDVWRRLKALSQNGDKLALLCWHDVGRSPAPDAGTLEELQQVCDQVRVASITRSPTEVLRRLALLWRMPSHAASRWVTTRAIGLTAWAESFRPDAVLLDGLYGGAVAEHLAAVLNVPLLYRSHNVEHAYMHGQLRRETKLSRRLGLLANCLGLARFEQRMHRQALRVFDISQEDCSFWMARGQRNIEWLPTIVDEPYVRRIQQGATSLAPIDVLYFGNLNTPNNVEAVLWLVREVLPLLKESTLRIVVAGSRPTDAVREAVAADPRVELVENPADMAPLIGTARVIVNPMLAGSGVNLKSVEMIFSEAALVSTTAGVKGLPPETKAAFTVADDSASFAAAVAIGLAAAPQQRPERGSLRVAFAGGHTAMSLHAGLKESLVK
jgi:hypothetical protein